MNLGELADLLEALPDEMVFSFGLGGAHSYRGYYDEVAFEPATNVSVAQMRHEVERAFNDTFYGWKGGEYRYSRLTPCWIAVEGSAGGALRFGFSCA